MASDTSKALHDDEGKPGVLSRLVSEFSFVRGNFLLLVLSWLVMDFAREIPGTYYPLYVEALGGSAASIGIIGFAGMLSQALVMFPGGYLADRYGRRWLVSSMLFGVAFSWLFYALATSWLTILMGSVVSGLCMIYMPAFHAIIMDSLPAERRGVGFSIINLIEAVSTTPAPLVAGFLYLSVGLVPSLRLGYMIAFAAFLVAAMIRLRIRETMKDPPRIDRWELVRSVPRSITESLGVWGPLPKTAFILFVISTSLMLSYSMISPVLVLYIVNDLGIRPEDWALVNTAFFISMLVFAIPAGKLIDRIGKKIPLILSMLMSVVGVTLFIDGDLPRLYVAVPLYGIVIILLNSSTHALFADLVPMELRGKVSGFTGFFSLLAMSLGTLLGGILYDRVSHPLPFQLQYVFVVPPLLLALMFIKEPENKEK